MKLKQDDFSYYKDIVKEDEQTHKNRMMRKNVPDAVIASYEGFLFNKEALENGKITDPGHGIQGSDSDQLFENSTNVIETWLSIAADTVIPSLYYQVPRPTIRAKASGSPFTAEILNGLIQNYFDSKAKVENQKCIMDAYLPYGFGVMKVGYNSRVGILKNKRTSLFSGEIKADGKKTDMESGEEYIKYERPFVERHSPRDTWLDWSKDFGKGNRITFLYDRTMQDLMDSNLYALDDSFIKYFASKKGDNRKVRFKVKETWIMIEGFAHKLVYIDEWDSELYWDKTPYQWLPCSLLRFKKTPDVLYSRSHGSLADSSQRELNYLNELWKEHVDKIRRQHLVQVDGLTENGKKALQHNEIDGIVECVKPPSNIYAQIGSNPMGSDVYSNIQNVRGFLQQILSAGGSVSGDVSADTATQEKGVQMGNYLRTTGMQDDIRDFNIDQIKKMTVCTANWGSPEVTVSITKKDIVDPATGLVVTGRDVIVGGDKGLSLSDVIIGNIDLDYLFDMDMSSASRPDYAVVRKQMSEAIGLGLSIKPVINSEGKELNVSEMYMDYLKTFDTLPNPQKYLRDLTEEEKASMAERQSIAQYQEMLKGAAAPTEEALISGANNVGMATGGMV